ncbi:hypothetical protein WJX81_005408 [Elliptochloris bilobata]|uniref:RNA helicase n=1 Tax=Elliptochloris bilobata TaxID=381761 RepID=A0AAW1QLV2_9CHLO
MVAHRVSAGPFQSLGVDDRVTGLLRGMDVQAPTPVQEAAIPRVLRGENIAIQSYTGSGKTLAYMLPVLSLAIQRAEVEALALAEAGKVHEAGTLQAIVVAPSRELAMQIVRVAHALLPPEARGCVQQCIGGANPHRQAEALKVNRPLLVVGTPGRLAEMSRTGVLQTHPTRILVLDEVDQLLAVQFQEDMTRLVQHCGRRAEGGRQTLLVSATLTPKVVTAAAAWCPGAQLVKAAATAAGPPASAAAAAAAPEQEEQRRPRPPTLQGWGALMREESGASALATTGSAGGVGTAGAVPEMPPTLEHAWLAVERRHRTDAVRRAIHALGAQRALVFMNFHQRLKDTQFKLKANGLAVGCLSGDMGKQARQAVLREFANGTLRALVVSDVAARGLDLPGCDAVINLELPSDAAHYAHRAGRTGRAGRQGSVLSLVEPQERFVIQRLSRRLGSRELLQSAAVLCGDNATAFAQLAASSGLPLACHMPGLLGAFTDEQTALLSRCFPGGILHVEEDRELLALLAQLRAAAGTAAGAGFAPSDLGRTAPLVTAQAPDGGGLAAPDTAPGTAPAAPTRGEAGVQAVVPALWNLDRLDQADLPLDGLYRFGTSQAPGTGQGVTVYAVDSGVRASHQEFAPWDGGPSRASHGRDMTARPGGAADASDCDGHGTHVGAVAIGRTVGVAKAAALVGVRVLACDGSGSVGDVVAGAPRVL